MKNYFRSLKRCKNKGIPYQPERTFQNEINPKHENKNNQNCPETQPFERTKNLSLKSIEDDRNKSTSTESVNVMKQDIALKLKMNKHDVTGQKLPSTSRLDTYKSQQNSKRQANHIKIDSQDKTKAFIEEYNSASFWRDPLPQVDMNIVSENFCEDEKVKPEDNQTVGQYLGTSEGQFVAATFCEKTIPEVNFGDLLQIKIDKVTELKEREKSDEETNNRFTQDRSIANQQHETIKINDDDKFSDKLNMLEQENEDLKNILNDVTEEIKTLETRIKALEEKDVVKESVTSMIVSNVEYKISTRY